MALRAVMFNLARNDNDKCFSFYGTKTNSGITISCPPHILQFHHIFVIPKNKTSLFCLFPSWEQPTALESGFPRRFCVILPNLQKHQTTADSLESAISWCNYEEPLFFKKELFIYFRECTGGKGGGGGRERISGRPKLVSGLDLRAQGRSWPQWK